MLGKLLVQGSTASNQLALDDPNLRNLAAEVRDEFLKATSGEDSCEHVIMSMSNIYIYTFTTYYDCSNKTMLLLNY